MAGPRTRIAPTPSGYLHAGNAWSFLIAWLHARSRGGSVHLRIDDLDTARLRPEYLDDIFASLEWLGLDWDTGPKDTAEFTARFSQRHRMAEYRRALETLRNAPAEGGPPAYVCACSREQARKASADKGTPGLYAGTCRDAGIDWAESAYEGPPERAGLTVRARVPADAEVSLRTIEGASLKLHPGREMGDFVVWQKAGLPSYQLASVVDDEALGIDCVVRGADLLPSTGAQAWLADRIGAKRFRGAAFLHHPLLTDAEGGKLSKSDGSESLRAFRDRGGPAPLLRGFAAWMGMEPGTVESARDLAAGFDPRRLPRADRPWSDFASGLR